MKHNIVETILGAVVLLVAGLFLAYGYEAANLKTVKGYSLSADFAGIGGLQVGSDVQISGVKVGSVTALHLDPETYLAQVVMTINESVRVPRDTAALITSEGLLGGRYLSLEPGSDEDMIPSGGKITYTQSPQNLEQLLGQFIFSMQKPDSEP